jgi:nucleoid DNA-binding protein
MPAIGRYRWPSSSTSWLHKAYGWNSPTSVSIQISRQNPLERGENVKLNGFGQFTVRDKAERVGRNPKTGVVVPIEPQRSVTFSASHVLKAKMNRRSGLSFGSTPKAAERPDGAQDAAEA